MLTLLGNLGVVCKLAVANSMLLQPEQMAACAEMMIWTLQEDEHQQGCLMEKRIREGKCGI